MWLPVLLLVGDVNLVISGAASGIPFAGFGIQRVSGTAAAQECDVGREREGECAMGVGGGCQSKVGQRKEGPALGAVAGIEVLFRNDQTCFAIPFFYFYQFHANIVGEAVFLENSCGVILL